jgi:plastocyanin
MVLGVMVVALATVGCAPRVASVARSHGDGQVVSIDALDHRFSPRLVALEVGRPITVTVHNSGLMAHTFTTGDPLSDVVVPARATRHVTFTPSGPTYFFCRFHEADGMKGTLCVRGRPCSAQAFP